MISRVWWPHLLPIFYSVLFNIIVANFKEIYEDHFSTMKIFIVMKQDDIQNLVATHFPSANGGAWLFCKGGGGGGGGASAQ